MRKTKMNVYSGLRRSRVLLIMFVSGGLILHQLAASDGTDATLAGVAPDAAIAALPATAASGSLIGVTLAPGGFSLASVNVVIRSLTNSAGRQLITDADGTFSVKDLVSGTYQITASKEGFATPSAATVEIAANKTASANVQLTQG